MKTAMKDVVLMHEIVNLVKECMRPGEAPSPLLTDRMNQFLNEGRAHDKGMTADNVDPQQLVRGIEVEMEHTKDPRIAKKIALDHLAEFRDYYSRLDRMESKAQDDRNNY